MIFADAQPVKAKAAGLNVSEVAMRTVSIAANGFGLGEVPPRKMLNYSTKACGGI